MTTRKIVYARTSLDKVIEDIIRVFAIMYKK